MTHSLYATIREIVRSELARTRTAELAVVQEQHPHTSEDDTDNFACTVALRDSGIVLKQVPVTTPRVGVASIPAVGELVLVQFIGGDVNAPVITGRLYNDQHRPPPNDDSQWIAHLPLDAGDDDAVHVELKSGESKVLSIKLGAGLSITLQDDDPVVSVEVDGGKATLTIARDGALSVASEGDIKLEGQGNIDIEASGDLNLKGATVNLN